MVLKFCFLFFPFVNFSSSEWQIIPRYKFGRLVMHPQHFSRGDISKESSSVVYFQWSISWSIGQWSIKRNPLTGCLYFFFNFACCRTFWRERVTVRCFGDNVSLSCCPWWTVCFSSRSRQITCSSHTTPLNWSKTTSGWLCPDDQITTGHRRRREGCWSLLPNI